MIFKFKIIIKNHKAIYLLVFFYFNGESIVLQENASLIINLSDQFRY